MYEFRCRSSRVVYKADFRFDPHSKHIYSECNISNFLGYLVYYGLAWVYSTVKTEEPD